MSSKSDDELMSLVALGDRTALSLLFDRHADSILGYACRLMGSQELAEDISQEVWLKVVRAASSYSGQGNFRAWIKTVTRNTSFNAIKKNQRLQPVEDVETKVDSEGEGQYRKTLEEDYLVKAKLDRVKAAIDELPEMQRLALVTLMYEDVSYEQIAEQLGVSLSSVKSLLFRARKTLVESLGE